MLKKERFALIMFSFSGVKSNFVSLSTACSISDFFYIVVNFVAIVVRLSGCSFSIFRIN